MMWYHSTVILFPYGDVVMIGGCSAIRSFGSPLQLSKVSAWISILGNALTVFRANKTQLFHYYSIYVEHFLRYG